MASPAASNIVLFQMMLHYKAQAESACRAAEEAQNRLHESASRLHSTRMQLVNAQDHVVHLTDRVRSLANGGEILINSIDQFYNWFLSNQDHIQGEHRDTIQRIMMRGDTGFAIVMGAPLVDLTTDEGIETPTDSDSEPETEPVNNRPQANTVWPMEGQRLGHTNL